MRRPWRKCLPSGFPKFHSTETALILKQKQSIRSSLCWHQESIWRHGTWSTSNETECLWGTSERNRLTTQLYERTQIADSHSRMWFLPKNCDSRSTTSEHLGASSCFFNDLPLAAQPSTFDIQHDKLTFRHCITSLTRPRWPFAVVGCQQDGHERRQDKMSLSDREKAYK